MSSAKKEAVRRALSLLKTNFNGIQYKEVEKAGY